MTDGGKEWGIGNVCEWGTGFHHVNSRRFPWNRVPHHITFPLPPLFPWDQFLEGGFLFYIISFYWPPSTNWSQHRSHRNHQSFTLGPTSWSKRLKLSGALVNDWGSWRERWMSEEQSKKSVVKVNTSGPSIKRIYFYAWAGKGFTVHRFHW